MINQEGVLTQPRPYLGAFREAMLKFAEFYASPVRETRPAGLKTEAKSLHPPLGAQAEYQVLAGRLQPEQELRKVRIHSLLDCAALKLFLLGSSTKLLT